MLRCCLIGLLLSPLGAVAQDDDSLRRGPRSIFSVGLAGHYGFVFAHSVDVENTRGARPRGLRAELVWQRIDEKTWQACTCYPRNGLQVSVMNFDNRVLGYGLNAGYFLEPTFRLGSAVSLTLRGSVGLAFLTNPYHPVRNPTNQSYSLPVNAYLSLGVGTSLRLSRRWSLTLSGQYEHASNGGLQEPNKGINYPTASVGLLYAVNPTDLPRRERPLARDFRHRRPRFDAYAFGTARTAERGEPTRYFLGGMGFTASKQVGKLSALTLGAETFVDFPSRELARRAGSNPLPLRAGVLLGHEFLLGNYVFSQQLGVYAYNPFPFFDRVYHRWGLTRRVGRSWAVGFNLLAHRQVANFLDLRVVRSW
jgi:hypothetical protein